MDGTDLNDHSDGRGDYHRHNLLWLLQSTNPPAPPSSQPPANNNRHSMENNNFSLNPTSQNPYFGYPSYQNSNPQNQPSGFLMEPGIRPNASPSFDYFFRGQNPENGLSRPLNQWPPAPAPPRQYQYTSFDQYVRGLRAENGLYRLNQSVPVPQYSSSNSSHTYFPLQNYEAFDLLSGFERLKIEDLGRSRPDIPRSNNSSAFRNLSTDPYAMSNKNGFPSLDHLGSSINGSPSASAALSSRINKFDVIRPRPNRVIYSSIEELRGRIIFVAEDEQGCRFLQKKVDERNPVDIDMIFSEVKDDLHELMRHQSANYLIQKLIGVLNEDQMTMLILSIVNPQQRLFSISDDAIGSRVIQKLLDDCDYPLRQPLTPEQKSLLVSALKKITVSLSKSMPGNHVIKRCLQKFPYEYTKDIVEEVADNCLTLATDKSGCCLLQECIKYAQEELKGRLIADVVSNALYLCDHSFGNYAVQYILGLKIPQVTADVVAQFFGNYFTLSQGKSSSHVVEKCLLDSGVEQSTCIIKEIILHPEVLELMLDPLGNYVIQTAWNVSQGRRIRQTLQTLVEMNSSFLQSHIYGKKVLARVRGNKKLFL